MSTAELTASPEWKLPSLRKAGMLTLIATESALFTIFVVAYVFYMGKSLNPPYPSQLLEVPWVASVALLGSSVTIMFAEWFLHKGSKLGFHIWWAITILLGGYFLGFTALEWKHLIEREHFTISTNVFGSTFYSLVGLHASHVIVGLIMLSLIWVLSLLGKVKPAHREHIEIISWYWHFVDVVWIVVLTLVYFINPAIQ